MSNTACVVYEAETAYLREYLGSPPVFARVRVAHLFCVFCFVCLRPASCVPNVASVARLSIRDCSVGLSSSCILCTQCCQCLLIVRSWLLRRFSLTFNYYLQYVLCLVYPMFPVSLDCLFFIAPSVFSNVYLLPTVCPVSCVPNVPSVSRLSVRDCSVGFL
jgi:hypothetical protein